MSRHARTGYRRRGASLPQLSSGPLGSALLLHSMEDKTKIQHRSDLSPEYFPILGGLLSLMNNEKEAGIIEIPFVLTCAATLECLLNDKIILYCIETYGSDDYEQFAEPLIWDGFLKKINTIIPLLSHNQYNIRTDSECYIELKGLIDVRNSLTHNKIVPERI